MIEQAYVGYGGAGSWYKSERWILVGIASITIVLQVWMVIEGAILFPRVRGILETPAKDASTTTSLAPPC